MAISFIPFGTSLLLVTTPYWLPSVSLLHRRGYDRFFAWYQLITLLVWALFVRRYLVGDSTLAVESLSDVRF